MDILETIIIQRRKDVEISKKEISEDILIQRMIQTYPTSPLSLYEILTSSLLPNNTNHVKMTDSVHPNPQPTDIPMIVAAEFKRASPSKGNIIESSTSIDDHARSYTKGGAHILSILTEPTWFHGSLVDMEQGRKLSEALSIEIGRSIRPIILRKEFIIDKYQILEARAYGADTVLLIVATLSTVDILKPFIEYSRSLGMEPLVEVNSIPELDIAIQSTALCIGINNRNLRTFTVDLTTTSRIVHCAGKYYQQQLEKEIEKQQQNDKPISSTSVSSSTVKPLAILSLSGIRSTEDIENLINDCIFIQQQDDNNTNNNIKKTIQYDNYGIPYGLRIMRGFLIGEALMRSTNPQDMVSTLIQTGKSLATKYLINANSSNAIQLDMNDANIPTLQHRIPINNPLLVKICGIKNKSIALLAAKSGTDLIGSICVPNSPRTITMEEAKDLNIHIKKFREQDPSGIINQLIDHMFKNNNLSIHTWTERIYSLQSKFTLLRSAIRRARPLTVGVFMDQNPSDVLSFANDGGFDMIQLHGNEKVSDYQAILNASTSRSIIKPIIKVIHVPLPFPDISIPSEKYTGKSKVQEIIIDIVNRIEEWSTLASLFLIDSKQGSSSSISKNNSNSGGTGLVFDHNYILQVIDTEIQQRINEEQSKLTTSSSISIPDISLSSTSIHLPLFLAGGLTPLLVPKIYQTLKDTTTNISSTPVISYINGMDVSSGVEYSPDCIIDTVSNQPVGKGVKHPSLVQEFITVVKKGV